MADRLPPGQGGLQNWNNINSNKPEEYSSEFVIDGIRYANVTNVSTGQRQLYFVQSISGARGAPITTTNADGTKTPGGTYDNFNRNNPGELAAAEAAEEGPPGGGAGGSESLSLWRELPTPSQGPLLCADP